MMTCVTFLLLLYTGGVACIRVFWLHTITARSTAGSKRKADSADFSGMQQKQTVRASHLLVKHR